MDGVLFSINFLKGLFALEAVLHRLRALSQGHGVYLRLVLVVLLAPLGVCVNLLSKEDIFHFLVNVCSCGWDRDCDVLLTLYCDPDVLGIGELAPRISFQGLNGRGELVRLGYRPHVVNVTLEVLYQPSESNYFWT